MSVLILALHSNQSSFKEVQFTTGLNVILADRSQGASVKDSRNGLGKTTLIEIIHFCLGARTKKHKGIVVDDLRGWAFSLSLSINDKDIVVTREIDRPSRVIIEGDTTGWGIQPKLDEQQRVLPYQNWSKVLGSLAFGLPIDEEDSRFKPTFRDLISYFIRRGQDAYSTPFEHFRKQPTWDKQVNNAFLLDLAWQDARDWQLLREQQEALDNLKKLKTSTQSGIVTRIIGSLGELEAARVQIEHQLRQRQQALSNFQVHPQYRELENEVNQLTADLHEITNENLIDRRLLAFYESSLEKENEPSSNDVVRLYETAGIELPNLIVRRLEDVENFHRQLVENRRQFLSSEIGRIKRAIAERERITRDKTNARASRLEILKTHGALEEHTRLQELYLETVASLREVNQRLEELRKIEEGKSALQVEKALLRQRALRDYEERHAQVERAISLFNSNSQVLYETPGQLIINIGANGFEFNVIIDRDQSEGISRMKIFCYDLMLAQLWSHRNPSPRFLIHDSTIFDGVDERQRALALELAARESSERSFQYICTLNSDMVPWEAFSPEFDFNSFVKLRLTDSEDGNLLGVKFSSTQVSVE